MVHSRMLKIEIASYGKLCITIMCFWVETKREKFFFSFLPTFSILIVTLCIFKLSYIYYNGDATAIYILLKNVTGVTETSKLFIFLFLARVNFHDIFSFY